MDLNFMNEKIKLSPIDVGELKPNYEKIRNDVYQRIYRSYVIQLTISMILLLIIFVVR